eukprot:NODE_755_length_2784_cov_3.475348.p1 GENE.NODE_755_length_2784_cov_3.475348~~NODE_755_length_2784_cov_3.475348.p1  ORF type:complete len:785 (+),score=194.49 NODE_755_length_2784_cov_3.475348:112-2466(+)
MGNSDSQVAFIGCVQRLLEEDVPYNDEAFWKELLTAPVSVEDVFGMISPEHVRRLRAEKPYNLEALLLRIAEAMAVVCAEGAVLPLPAMLVTQALTTTRLLTRLAPLLLEDSGNVVVDEILWAPGGLRAAASAAAAAVAEEVHYYAAADRSTITPVVPAAKLAAQTEDLAEGRAAEMPVVEDKIEADVLAVDAQLPGAADASAPAEVPRHAQGSEAGKATEMDAAEIERFAFSTREAGAAGSDGAMARADCADARAEVVCAQELLNGISRLLFLPGFTVTPSGWQPGSPLASDGIDERVLWRRGIGVPDARPRPKQSALQDARRCEVLRCVLACASGPLFQTPTICRECPSQWLLYFTSGATCNAANLFSSLMSTVLLYEGAGWGGYFAKEQELLALATQVLCVMIDSDPGAGPDGAEHQNVYRAMVRSINQDAEIDLVFAGFVRLLSTVHLSKGCIPFYQETLVLLWHLITINNTLLQRVVKVLDSNRLLIPVLYLIQDAHSKPELVGLQHTATFILLVLSAERPFAVRLNMPYQKKPPLLLPSFKGCYADVVVLVLHKIIFESVPKLQSGPLVEMLLTVLCNISPYIKSFAQETALKLMLLVERCARPSMLLRAECTHQYLMFLVQLLNNVVQYQYEGNTVLVYSILRQKEIFEQLTPSAAAGGELAEPASSAWDSTDAWLESFKSALPLQTVLCLIQHLIPQIDELCAATDVAGQAEVMQLLRQTTPVGILPVPHPLVVRSYRASTHTTMWFTCYLWGIVFTRSGRLPLYDWRRIKLVDVS